MTKSVFRQCLILMFMVSLISATTAIAYADSAVDGGDQVHEQLRDRAQDQLRDGSCDEGCDGVSEILNDIEFARSFVRQNSDVEQRVFSHEDIQELRNS